MEPTRRKIKEKVAEVLHAPGFDSAGAELHSFRPMQVVNALISFLSNSDGKVRMRAVSALGSVVGKLAEGDIGSARNVIRRLMLSLTEESGGIGWGAPEAIGEILARSEKLAQEYHAILVSYIDPRGEYLDFKPLQKGALRGVKRLAEARPGLIQLPASALLNFNTLEDPEMKKLAGSIIDLVKPQP